MNRSMSETKANDEMPEEAAPRTPWWRRRWLKWTALVVVVLAGSIYVLVPLVAAPVLRGKLQAMVDSRLDARLEMKRVFYVFPYGLRVSGAKLVTDGPDGSRLDLLDIPTLEIALAKLPFGEGPLVIRKLIFGEPAIHLIRTEGGLVGRRLVKDEDGAQPDPSRDSKLSDVFELRHVRIAGGSVVYDDRTKPGTVPLAWKDVNVDLETRPATNPLYGFRLAVDNRPMARAHVAGTFDIDSLRLVIDRLRVDVESKPEAKESPAPASVQQFISRNGLYGKLSLDGRASLDLKDLAGARFDATVALADDAVPGGAAFTVRCSTSPLGAGQRALAALQQTAADDASTRPTTAPEKSSPTLYVLAEKGRKAFGENVVIVNGANAVINWDAGRWDLHELRGRLVLGEDKRSLPKFVRTAVEGPGFIGTADLSATGGAELVRKSDGRRDYRFDVHAMSADLLATDRRLRFTDVVLDFAITPGAVTFLRNDRQEGIRAMAYGGRLAAFGSVTTRRPVRYDFTGAARGLDLAALARDWAEAGEGPAKLSGRGSIEMRFNGSASREGDRRASETFRARGEVEVVEGDFYEFPVLREIVAAVAPSREAATVGQAAGVFEVAERKITFGKAAVSAPLLGLQGSGAATFEGELDFRVVAAPLADWKEQLKRTKIPVVDDVGAELLGGIQKLLNSASGKLLYQFRVGGTAGKPTVTAEAVPVLTEDAVRLFAEMMGGKEEGRLLERVRAKNR